MRNEPVSPIALSVIWSGFLSIAEEMGTTLQMTAFSEAVREGQDFSTAIFDSRGRLVAQGNFTPGHLGSMPYVIKSIMEIFPPGSLQPGDGVLLNDSKLGSGHYPDFFFVSPVFLAERQIGYLINTAHHIDVGGAAPGSQKVQGISERFQEGLRILPVRVLRSGEFDEDILRLMERPSESVVPFELAREIATREGAKAVLDGEIVRLGQSYVVSARLVSALDGQELATFRETADGENELIGALGKLSRAVRERAGESLRTIRASSSLDMRSDSSGRSRTSRRRRDAGSSSTINTRVPLVYITWLKGNHSPPRRRVHMVRQAHHGRNLGSLVRSRVAKDAYSAPPR